MTNLERLKLAESLQDVAYLLGFKPKALAYILYVKSDASKYKSFSISKKSGGTREIRAPTDELLNLQRRLSNLLQDCDAEIRRSLGLTRAISHGFVRKKSIMTNASQHLHRRFLFNTDIENFFGAINFGRVRGFFISNKHFQLHEKVATILAQIVCYENSLPQGAPTSPVVSNLIAHILDIHLARLAIKTGCVYSRYADDLSFSTNKKVFPKEVAVNSVHQPHTWSVGKDLNSIIEKQGFLTNHGKSRMHYADSRQEVTGLVVNKRVNVKFDYRAMIRQMVHRLTSTGAFQFRYKDKAGQIVEKDGNAHQLAGMLSFVKSVNDFERKRQPKVDVPHGSNKVSGFEASYRKFLLYKDFYATDRPVILFEGKTDNIYIRAAIRSLAKSFSNLAQVDKNGKVTLSVRLYNYTSTTREVLGLGGGSDNLKKFIQAYGPAVAKFKAEKSAFPIIVLIDNDKGAKQIYSVLKEITGVNVTGNEGFIKVHDDIYVVPTPKEDGEDSCIEDFFDESVLDVKLKGKSFDKGNDFDEGACYGKFAFAKNVVKPNEKTIDFNGFVPILALMDSIIDAHVEADKLDLAKASS
jgi:RNA-directed DNA polymerase